MFHKAKKPTVHNFAPQNETKQTCSKNPKNKQIKNQINKNSTQKNLPFQKTRVNSRLNSKSFPNGEATGTESKVKIEPCPQGDEAEGVSGGRARVGDLGRRQEVSGEGERRLGQR